MDWNALTVNAWQFAIFLLILIIPITIGLFALRTVTRSARKTIRTFTKKK